jgi:F420H(2)-dependent quinone reductase
MKTLERVQESGRVSLQVPAVPPQRIMAATNVIVRFLLRSPLHFRLGNTLLLLTYRGRKSGKRYTNPVAYTREGDVVRVFTYHSWWKNVRGGAPVLVEIKGHRMGGTAEAISEEKAAIATSLLAFLRKHPALAKGYNVPLDADGQPNPEAVQQAAQFVVMVRIQLSGGPTALQPTTVPPGESFRLLPPSWRRPALVSVKAVHSLIYFSIEFCMGYLIYAGLKGHENRRTGIAAGVVAAESLIFVGNRCRCPLTGLAEELGATRGSVTDIYLPRWLASNLVPIHVPLLALALYLHTRNFLRQSRGKLH